MSGNGYDDNELSMAGVLSARPYLEGVIFAVAACPEIPMPEKWMPWVLRADLNVAVSKEQADQLADFLMGRLRAALDAMRKGESLLPADYVEPSAPEKEPSARQQENLKNWLKGVLTGHQQLESQWQQAWKSNEDEALDMTDLATRLTRCLKLFSTLANPSLTLSQAPADKRQALAQGLPKLAASLPAMLKEYVAISGELVQALPNQFEVVAKDAANDPEAGAN
ncbi:UPF0149 family protein [Alteromonas gilva]|uniref:UPF0149 family protein n=1 Tax=Alteromonas gilva TaxID=2987522 RepID=A0ABT5L682_9ALTE|nr:UPF0149 family protein [Alteromonas gilva]MDC8832531.1 UPF0149 family protein [Alteromonas gilva]